MVALPAGSDPADLVRERGAEAVRTLVDGSVPFVRFHVEQILSGPLGSAEQKDAALAELRPVLAELGPTVMREELVRLVADRLDLSEGLVASLLSGRAAGASPSPSPSSAARGDDARAPQRRPAPATPLGQAERTERTFLALCIALPDLGREALRKADLDKHFTTDRTRRAAAYLKDHLAAPIDDLTGDDPTLAAVVTELAVRAEREPALPATLEAQQLDLELRRLEREIAAASTGGAKEVSDLAAERTQIKAQFDRAIDKATQGSRE